VVLDIGANIGQYGSQLRRGGFAGRIVSFEPVSAFHRQLHQLASEDGRWETKPWGLGSADTTATINVAGTLSSLLAIEDRAYGSDGMAPTTEPVEVRRLDSIRDEVLKPRACYALPSVR
jgi:FkbM family methyltransferase